MSEVKEIHFVTFYVQYAINIIMLSVSSFVLYMTKYRIWSIIPMFGMFILLMDFGFTILCQEKWRGIRIIFKQNEKRINI